MLTPVLARSLPQNDYETSSSSSSSTTPTPRYTNSSTTFSTTSSTMIDSEILSGPPSIPSISRGPPRIPSVSSDSEDRSHTASDTRSTTSTYSDDGVSLTMPSLPIITLSDNSTITTVPSRSPSSVDDNITASNCSGVLRLHSTPIEVVTQTVTEGFTVTVTAANQTLTTPPIEYPLPPCTTIFSSITFPPAAPGSTNNVPTVELSVVPTATAAGFKSTVFVTKKTPVPVLQVPTVPQYGMPTGPQGQTNPSPTPPPDFGGHTSPTPENQNHDNQNGQPGNNNYQNGHPPSNDNTQNNNNQNGQNNGNQGSESQGGGSQGAGIGGIIASIINQSWTARPAPSTPANNGNPSGPAPGSSPGNNNQGNPAPANPAVIISNILKLTTGLGHAPPPTPTGQPGQNIPVLIGPSDVVIGNQVVPMPSASDQAKVVVVNGQSYTVAATQVVGPSTTIPLSAGGGSLGASSVPIVVGDVPVVVVGTSQAVISGQTYAIGPSAKPTTIVVNGQTISIGSGGVGLLSTTVMGSAFSSTAIGGVNVGVGASQAVISGTTYNIGPSATPTTIVLNGQTISIGSGGVGFASTTLGGAGFATTAIGGVTLGIGSSQVVISGTTYNTGPSATPTTIVVNGQTISIGPSGVGFASTTIAAAGATGSSSARTTSGNSLPSRTGSQSSAPTASGGASSSSTTVLGTIPAFLIAGVVGFILL